MATSAEPISRVACVDGDSPDRRARATSLVRSDRWVGEDADGINYSGSLCFGTPLRRCSIQ